MNSIPQPPGKVKLQSAPDTAAGQGFLQGLAPGESRVERMKGALQRGVETAAADPSAPLETRLRQERGMDPDGEATAGFQDEIALEQEGPFTGEPSSDTIEIGKSLGAKAANYDVMDLDTGERFTFAEGTKIQNVQVFAGRGSRVAYRRAAKYADLYGGKPEDWQHAKGFGLLETPDGDRQAEVHWVQCAGLGKFEFFLKEWLD